MKDTAKTLEQYAVERLISFEEENKDLKCQLGEYEMKFNNLSARIEKLEDNTASLINRLRITASEVMKDLVFIKCDGYAIISMNRAEAEEFLAPYDIIIEQPSLEEKAEN